MPRAQSPPGGCRHWRSQTEANGPWVMPGGRPSLPLTYEGLVLLVALGWGTAEIGWLGARPSSMTAISGLILSCLGFRVDNKRKRQ